MKIQFGQGTVHGKSKASKRLGERIKAYIGSNPIKIIFDMTGEVPPDAITLPIKINSELKEDSFFKLQLKLEDGFNIEGATEMFEIFKISNQKMENLSISRFSKQILIFGKTDEVFFIRLRRKPNDFKERYIVFSLKLF